MTCLDRVREALGRTREHIRAYISSSEVEELRAAVRCWRQPRSPKRKHRPKKRRMSTRTNRKTNKET